MIYTIFLIVFFFKYMNFDIGQINIKLGIKKKLGNFSMNSKKTIKITRSREICNKFCGNLIKFKLILIKPKIVSLI